MGDEVLEASGGPDHSANAASAMSEMCSYWSVPVDTCAEYVLCEVGDGYATCDSCYAASWGYESVCSAALAGVVMACACCSDS